MFINHKSVVFPALLVLPLYIWPLMAYMHEYKQLMSFFFFNLPIALKASTCLHFQELTPCISL